MKTIFILLVVALAAFFGMIFLGLKFGVPVPAGPVPAGTGATSTSARENVPNRDIPDQKPLPNPPRVINAVYLTSWEAGKASMVDYVIELSQVREINAVVIDIKDSSGYLAYQTDLSEVQAYRATDPRIPKVNATIKKFHDAGVYVIGRITVFEDPVLAKARPDLAIQSEAVYRAGQKPSIDTLWRDQKGLAWIDPAAQDAWSYNAAIAQDASARGFDEINFDYIRFPSDGDLSDMHFIHWDGVEPRTEVLGDFFSFLRSQLPTTRISADLFGLTTSAPDDLGVGQSLKIAARYFDFVSPMLYPSHYAEGYLGFAEPAEHPYEVVAYSTIIGKARLGDQASKLRPWLQDFDLKGIPYGVSQVRDEINAVKEMTSGTFSGFMLWNPLNVYTYGALGTK